MAVKLIVCMPLTLKDNITTCLVWLDIHHSYSDDIAGTVIYTTLSKSYWSVYFI